VLARDRYRCQGCGAAHQRTVHHRRPGRHASAWLITLCPACHAVVHRLQRHRRWLPDLLLALWREQHPNYPSSYNSRSKPCHASLITTERYLGVHQDLNDAPCDYTAWTCEPRNTKRLPGPPRPESDRERRPGAARGRHGGFTGLPWAVKALEYAP
jgi:hypothetical protein